MGTWNFTYDSLNRLVTAAVGSNAPAQYANNYGCWSYDAFGNRTAQSMSTTACGDNPPLTSWAQYNGTVNGSGNNQMSATSQNSNQANGYDAAGDVTNDGVNQYLYDAEGRICAVASTPVAGLTTLTGYIYDADGTRVSKGTLTQFSCDMNPADSAFNGFQPTNDYILGPAGEQAAEMGVGGSTDGGASSSLVWLHSNIWAGGSLLGTYDGGAGVISADSTYGLHFYFDDPLGTRRVQTDYAGVVEQTCQSLPYGDGETCAPTPTENLFTGKERDAETNNDYFGARYYASSMGRFMSPDPSGLNYADITSPQSFNLYAYVLNNPLNSIDPTGMYCDYSDHNDAASMADPSEQDYNSNSDECTANGGQWDDDAYTQNGADIAGRPQYAVSALVTPPAPGTDPEFDMYVAMDVQWLAARQPQSPDIDPSLALATGIMSQGIPKACALGFTGKVGGINVTASTSGKGTGISVAGHTAGTVTPQANGLDMRSASPLFKSVPVGVYLSPSDPSGNSISSVSLGTNFKGKVGPVPVNVKGEIYLNTGTYTPNIGDSKNCPN